MKFECLPNEIFVECFEYLNGIDLLIINLDILGMEEIRVTCKSHQSHIVAFLSFCRYTMLSMRKKRNSLWFYLLIVYENEFSCIEITFIDVRTTKK
jgi:hypothetical protein